MSHIIYTVTATLFGLCLGFQIRWAELSLLTGRYRYRIQRAQGVTYGAAILALLGIAGSGVLAVCPATSPSDAISPTGEIFRLLIPLAVAFIGEWLMTLRCPSKAWMAWGVRALLCIALQLSPIGSQIPFVATLLVGLYLRNSPFGIPYANELCLAAHLKRQQTIPFDTMDYCSPAERAALPDTSYAGLHRWQDEGPLPRYEVTAHGLTADGRQDCLPALQRLIDRVGKEGGGIIHFPAGQYRFCTSPTAFIHINHPHIILEGATDEAGKPLATLVSEGATVYGGKNPWISPFFITTGEALQPSNEFWGLQFRKPRTMTLRSNSLADPGSDGSIITPEVTTSITAPAAAGDRTLHVADTGSVGRYILVGLYNASPDGDLIRDILGQPHLRPEWICAGRAGAEEAPSYQWLVEVEKVVDEHTLKLVRPLLRDIDLSHTPVVCNVELLEGIAIRNLHIQSRWNGLFRHHGFPIYYNIPRTQAMDYGWNGINMKRCAHSLVENVVIEGFSNPLYVQDSRNVTVRRLNIGGRDGHQGLKAYMHTCDCLFEDIVFRSHFADMMGGEGPAYANLFRRIAYLNPVYYPVDYDFHGFASEPMSPPSDNMFCQIYGFRYIKGAGSLSHLPACGRRNVWWDTVSEGERQGTPLFYAMTYREKRGLIRMIYAVGYAAAMMQKKRRFSPKDFISHIRQKLADIDRVGIPRSEHGQFFPDCHVYGMHHNQ